jgi:methylglutaconyl-CoA hydratase
MAVLSGAGKTFCAGADLGWMARTIDYDHEENIHDAWALARLFARLDALPVPLVERVHGGALGVVSGWWPSATSRWQPKTRCLGSLK